MEESVIPKLRTACTAVEVSIVLKTIEKIFHDKWIERVYCREDGYSFLAYSCRTLIQRNGYTKVDIARITLQ